MLGPLAAASGLVVAAAPAAEAEDSRAVEITVVGDAEASEATRVVLDELLAEGFAVEHAATSELDLSTVVTPPVDAPVRLARVWIDLRASERATIYIVDGPWERIMIRHVPTPQGYGEIQREQVGHITSGSIEALASGARIGIERVEAAQELGVEAEPAPVPLPLPLPLPAPNPAPPPADVAAWLAGAWTLSAFASAPVLTHGPTLSAALELRRPRVRPNFGFAIHYGLPVRVTTPDVRLRLDAVGLRGRVGMGPRVGSRVVLRPWVGAGADLVRVEAKARNPQTEPFPAFWTPVPIVELGFGVAIALRRALELRPALAAEADLVDTTYAFENTGATVFDPWPVRVTASLGLAFDPLHWRG